MAETVLLMEQSRCVLGMTSSEPGETHQNKIS